MISIVTVTYNNIDDLRLTCSSVTSQEFKGYEHVIIDGSSKDGTVEYLSSINTNKMKSISEPDNGIYDAMNKGVKNSNYPYIIFMNAGDIFYDDTVLLNIYNSIVDDDSVDYYFGDAIIKYNKKLVYRRAKLNQMSYVGYRQFDKPYCHQSLCLNRMFLLDHPFNLKYPIVADFESYHDMIGLKSKYLSIPVSVFDTGGVSDLNRMSVHYSKLIVMFNRYGLKYKMVSHYILCMLGELFKSRLRRHFRK